MELYQSFIDKVGELFKWFEAFISKNPAFLGIIFTVLGLVFLTGAILDKNWALEGPSSRNRYFLIDVFGRFFTRVFVGACSIISIVGGLYYFITLAK